jgi:hypothetical protein
VWVALLVYLFVYVLPKWYLDLISSMQDCSLYQLIIPLTPLQSGDKHYYISGGYGPRRNKRFQMVLLLLFDAGLVLFESILDL